MKYINKKIFCYDSTMHSIYLKGSIEGIDSNYKTYNNTSIFHYLALSGNYDTLKQVINDYNINPLEYKNNNETSLFHYIALSGNYYALKQSINHYNINPLEHKNNYGNSLFHYLASSGNYDALKQAINDFKDCRFIIKELLIKKNIEIPEQEYNIKIINDIQNDNCAICLNTLNKHPFITTSCNHTFHYKCINKLKNCPVCRCSNFLD